MKRQDIVYRTPGTHQRPGGTFDYKAISSDDELNEAIKEGWFCTLREAVAKKHDEVAPPPAPTDELETLGADQPPTRAELEQKAKELRLSFKKTISDEELAKLIEKALGG